jgi:putative transposase
MKDYAHGNKQKKMTLEATEFLRRFAQHVLPWGLRPHSAIRISHEQPAVYPAGACPKASRHNA